MRSKLLRFLMGIMAPTLVCILMFFPSGSYVSASGISGGILSSDNWDWQNPLPQGNWLRGVWKSTDGEVFAVGDMGTIIHYDGNKWTTMDSGTIEQLNGIWGINSHDVFAVGWMNTILHFDGMQWTSMPCPGGGNWGVLFSIWGTSANDVFAVGSVEIMHYNGSNWSLMDSRTCDLLGVWGSSATDVFAVGMNGMILHYDGTGWSSIAINTSKDICGVWGSSPTDVFAVGRNGTILHYNGSSWSPMISNTFDDLSGVWGSAANDVFAVGRYGLLMHYDGSSWNLVPGGIYSNDGGVDFSLCGVYGSSPADIFAVGRMGIILHYDGNEWSLYSAVTYFNITGVWGTSSVNVYATSWGKILHFNGNKWENMEIPASMRQQNLIAIWGSSQNDIWVAGGFGSCVFYHYNGTTWTEINYYYTVGYSAVGKIWGTSANDIFAVGNDGHIMHYDGSNWSLMNSNTSFPLYGVWGNASNNVYAVGGYGTILHYDGLIWSKLSWPTTEELDTIWGTSPNNIYIGTMSGGILHYDGLDWHGESFSFPSYSYILSIYGNTASNVYAVGDHGKILRYDGNDWVLVSQGMFGFFVNVWISPEGDVFVVGDYGRILHRSPPPNTLPVASDQQVNTNEDTAKAITLIANDVDGDSLTYTIITQPVHGILSGQAPNVTYVPLLNYNGSDSLTFKANDGNVNSNVATVNITVISVNDAPVANNQSVITNEDTGKTFTLTANDVDGDSLVYSIFSHPGQGTLSGTVPNLTYTPNLNYNGSDSFTFKTFDGQTDSNEATVSITVKPVNDAPDLGTIIAPVDPVNVLIQIKVSADFSDPDVLDTHTAIWDWGDSTSSSGVVTEATGSGSVNGNHIYTSAGVYTLTLTVTDESGTSDFTQFQYVVIYNPEGGFVTGGGWINSVAGAYIDDPTLIGKATFGFVSAYKKGATTPTGNTEFQYKVANLNFHSESYDWLVVAGAKAQYKGIGTINGNGEYKFMLTAIDGQINGGGGVDKFRIRIWDDSGIIYDNMLNAPDSNDPQTILGGGSIVIHK
jgi:hypothetical protein